MTIIQIQLFLTRQVIVSIVYIHQYQHQMLYVLITI